MTLRRYLGPAIGIALLLAAVAGAIVTRRDAGKDERPAAELAASAREAAGEAPSATKPKIAAPGFTVKTLAGAKVDPAAQKGKVVILDFWATWCGPCKMTIPGLQKMHEQYGDKGLMIVGVSPEDTETVTAFAKEQGMTYAVAADEKGARDGSIKYAVDALPTMVVIDKKGFVRDYHVGVDPDQWPDRVEKIVRDLLAEPA